MKRKEKKKNTVNKEELFIIYCCQTHGGSANLDNIASIAFKCDQINLWFRHSIMVRNIEKYYKNVRTHTHKLPLTTCGFWLYM